MTIAATRRDQRFSSIIRAASEAFATWGLARTQIQDIARHAEVAPGTIYLYAASKQGLFDLALRDGLTADSAFLETIDPPHDATRDSTLAWASELANWRTICPSFATAVDDDREVRSVLDALWGDLHTVRYAVRLVERSVREWSDLAALFFEHVRTPLLLAIVDWLERRRASGVVHFEGDPTIAAWHTLAFTIRSAVHREFDPGKLDFDNHVRAMTVQLLTKGLSRCQA